MSDTYQITPLEWEFSGSDYHETWSAGTTFAELTVNRIRVAVEDGSPWAGWKWSYCFDEYHDEGYQECESPEEGKRLAEEHWQKRLREGLTQVQENSHSSGVIW